MLQTLFECAPDAIVVFDDAGRLLDANPAACTLFGVARPELLRRDLHDFLESDALRRTIAAGDDDRGDGIVRTTEGRAVPVEYRTRCHFEPGRNLAVLRDIAERKRAEAELRESAEFLRRLIESSHDCIKVLDLDGRLLSINEGGRRLLEMESVEPYLGRPWTDLWRGGDTDRAAAAVESARRGEVARFEGFSPTLAGTPRWWETVIAPIDDAAGRPERLLAVSRDVTARVQAEAAHHAAGEKAREATEAASRAKDEFLATLAHELRSPLAAILNGVATLDTIGSMTPEARSARGVIRRQTSYLARLLDDLLDVARIGERKIELQLEALDLRGTVEAALEREQPRIEGKRQSVSLDLPPHPVHVRGDKVRLCQVAANLINNASKYSPEGGEIRVAVREEGDEAVLAVRDNGIGIPRERLDDVFELFTQLQRTEGRTEGGLGVGLTLARRLAGLHGGTVSATSEGPGRGSEFVVRLRRLPSGEDTAAAPAAHAHAAHQKMLVIEDNADTREMLAMVMELAGHEVRAAATAHDGLAAAASMRPSVVIADIGLPDMDGYELARRLRGDLGDDCLLIAFSGFGREEDRARSAAAGFDLHVLKPVEPAALLDLIASRVASPRRASGSFETEPG